MSWFDKIMPSRIKTERRTRSVPEGLWIKCPLLIAIGKADAPPSWAREVLEGRDRTRNAATAPAAGLYLVSVRYPAAFALPATSPPEVPAPDRL